MTSEHWDFLTTYASRRGETGTYHGSAIGQITARTADPRLNPAAVGLTESSTRFKKAIEGRWIDLVHVKALHGVGVRS